VGVAIEGAIGNDVYLGQQRGQSAGSGGLGRASLAADQYASDLGADGVEDQRRFHGFLTNDSGKGKNDLHGSQP
jgi:hypothetical protein